MGTVPTRRARVPHTTQVLTAGVSPTAKQISPLPWQPGINAGCPSFVHRTPVHKQNDTLLHRTLRCWVGRASACRSGFRATPGDFVASLPHNFSPPQAGRSGRPMTVHRRPDAAGASRGGQVGASRDSTLKHNLTGVKAGRQVGQVGGRLLRAKPLGRPIRASEDEDEEMVSEYGV